MAPGSGSNVAKATSIASSAPISACAWVATIFSTALSDQPICAAMTWFVAHRVSVNAPNSDGLHDFLKDIDGRFVIHAGNLSV
jgi:hypothetical protein